MNVSLILIQCRDNVGLVALITRVLATHKLNIVAMREFVDEANNRFFARIEFVGELVDETELEKELLEGLPKQAELIINPKAQKRIAILVTKEYHCLGDALVRHYFNTLGAEICCVVGNYDILKPFTDKFDVPFHYISHENKTKEQFENELIETLEGYELDYIILAKFMRILSPVFVKKFANKIINIHHSFLPAFIGASPYRQAFERGVKLLGATAHFVTNELDEGPIIVQQTIPVNHTFGTAQMVIVGKEIETSALSKAMRLVFQDRVFLVGNRTIIFE